MRLFWQQPGHRDSEESLRAWHCAVERADWERPVAVKAQLGSASIIAGNRVVFTIAGNKYRLVVRIYAPYKVVYVRFVSTHAEYDRIDAASV